jgi:ectoine hydroxylase-related dioxygenase (phytanoyl-CoA dioxygenase family)
MENLRLDDTRFSSGFVISKPPQSPPLFWHYDWAAWNHPYSYEVFPAQIFLMLYLVDTTPANGCLRVIPKSHIEDHPLHDVMGLPHAEELQRAKNLSRA